MAYDGDREEVRQVTSLLQDGLRWRQGRWLTMETGKMAYDGDREEVRQVTSLL